jgi:hypothetical protein
VNTQDYADLGQIFFEPWVYTLVLNKSKTVFVLAKGLKDVDHLLIAKLDAIIHLGIHYDCVM